MYGIHSVPLAGDQAKFQRLVLKTLESYPEASRRGAVAAHCTPNRTGRGWFYNGSPT